MNVWILIAAAIVIGMICFFIGGIKIMNFVMKKSIKKNIDIVNNIIEEDEDKLRELSKKSANISSEGIEITARAIKKGFSEDGNRDSKFCKNCGQEIDLDSKFCNYCGKEQ